ncbi:alpha/beta fold hydrolase [Paenibacillus sp. FSL M7-0896]|uniref:alpha/beta hydrolase family protein n=1 Tax=Paenibacillus sp. FSL M7-0896 TaxID=2921610 RepID=UPI0030DC760D
MITKKRLRPLAQDIGRMLGQGLSPEDFIKLMNRTELNCDTLEKISEGEDFVLAADSLGDDAYAYAEEHEKLGHLATASQYFSNACALYRLADYGIKDPTEEKMSINKKIYNSFRKSKAVTSYDKVINIEVPFEGNSIPGYLLIPDNAPKNVPVVIYVPGATGYKEENYLNARKCWERGVATIIFDGPGQGEALHYRNMYYTVDNYERAVKAIIDFIHNDPRLGNKIGIMGISYGGYLATRATCFNNDFISALVCRGGSSKTDDLTRRPIAGIEDFYLKNFTFKFNEYDNEIAKKISSEMNIGPFLKNITCPVLVQHTEEDPILGVEGAKNIYEMVSSENKEYYKIPGNVHCGCNENEKVGNHGADWIVDILLNA